jgi:hypothetical protein
MSAMTSYNNADNPPPNLTELFALIQDMKRKQAVTPKWFEMSHATLYTIEAMFDLLPRTEPCSTLWGIDIYLDETLPLNEIKPVY